MSFSWTNALAVFQQFINDIFSDPLNIFIVIYLDDILIYSDDMSQHWEHVKEVLHQLCKIRLYAKAKKCEFHSDSIEYLEYILSSSRLTMSSDKINAIQNWPKPKKVKNVQVFLGFTNFY